jgi:hypothetical protein
MALVLLALNDHLLRHLWPSSFTGKLGDFAWLFFMPLVAAALLEIVGQGRPARGRRLAGLAGFGLVSGIFALAKTVPACHAAVVAAATDLFGFPVGWRRDPTDLIALVAMAPAWLLWQRTAPRPTKNRLAGLFVMAAAVLLTVANSLGPDYGYRCVWTADGKLYAVSSYVAAVSMDGGITWQQLAERPADGCTDQAVDVGGVAVLLADPTQAGVHYRYIRGGQVIERSTDAGLTWRAEYRLGPKYEAAVAYANKKRPGTVVDIPLPASAVIDSRTGNVIFAMGHDGILVREASGEYIWPIEAQDGRSGFSAAKVPELLIGEGVLAIGVTLLGLSTLGNRVARTRARDIFLVIGWLLLGLAALATPPALTYGYGIMVEWVLLTADGLVILLLTVDTLFRVSVRNPHAWPRIVLASCVAGLIFLLPYVLWAFNAIPRYYPAEAIAAALVIAVLLSGRRWVDQLAAATGIEQEVEQ